MVVVIVVMAVMVVTTVMAEVMVVITVVITVIMAVGATRVSALPAWCMFISLSLIVLLCVSFSTLLLQRGGKECVAASLLPGRLPVRNSTHLAFLQGWVYDRSSFFNPLKTVTV